MSGLTFSNDAAEKLIAAYSSTDLVRQRDATLQRLNLRPGNMLSTSAVGLAFCARAWLRQSVRQVAWSESTSPRT
jgi:hypothetical protein